MPNYLKWGLLILGTIVVFLLGELTTLTNDNEFRYRRGIHYHLRQEEPIEVKVEALGVMRVTGYRSVPEQCKPDPWYTSIGVHTNRYIVAVSQDLLQSGQVKYNDVIYIEGIGTRIVADAMGLTRHYVVGVKGQKLMRRLFVPQRKSIDVWCETFQQEKHLGISHRRVWIVHTTLKGCTSSAKETNP